MKTSTLGELWFSSKTFLQKWGRNEETPRDEHWVKGFPVKWKGHSNSESLEETKNFCTGRRNFVFPKKWEDRVTRPQTAGSRLSLKSRDVSLRQQCLERVGRVVRAAFCVLAGGMDSHWSHGVLAFLCNLHDDTEKLQWHREERETQAFLH